jgi:hypothetical protein
LDSSYKIDVNTQEALLLPCYTLVISEAVFQTPNTMNMLLQVFRTLFRVNALARKKRGW